MILIPVLVIVSLLMACAVTAVDRRSPGVGMVVTTPILPPIMKLRAEPYNYQRGNYYHYDNKSFQARSKSEHIISRTSPYDFGLYRYEGVRQSAQGSIANGWGYFLRIFYW